MLSHSKGKMKKIVITSGFFNPIHIGHINLMKEAKELGDLLVVIVNNDEQVRIKGGVAFMAQEERVGIIKGLKYADEVFLSIDNDITVARSLEHIAKKYLPAGRQVQADLYFAKGGDRNIHNLPESEKAVCQKFNITIVNGVGGSKVQSSSELLKKINFNEI
ncbi:MAG: adenylyltransferase/cytidyltransferase family protein [bacterium]|nr:adenylyltransferase/cytidyltransferase family protein [bacterium]